MYHKADWTPQAVERFWNFVGPQQAQAGQYFSKTLGAGLMAYVRNRTTLSGPCLDLGCGPGYFLEHLDRAGLPCQGVDSSPESVHAASQRLADRTNIRGISVGSVLASGLPDASVPTLFCLEVLEHLPPDLAGAALDEMHRVLAPGGLLILTVPNAEDLAQNEVACPECGCVFHRWQHMASYSAAILEGMLGSRGFTELSVKAVDLGHWGFGLLRRWRAQFITARSGAKLPHLVAIARRG